MEIKPILGVIMARLKNTLRPVYEDTKHSAPMCEHSECRDVAHYRAPKNRKLREYHWFCLTHVRAYNADWNFYQGMSPGAIQSHQHADLTWQRPSWSFHDHHKANPHIQFEVLEAVGRTVQLTEDERNPFPPHTPEGKALEFLGLTYPCDYEDVKKAYKQYVKKHHPDINNNSKVSHDRIKRANEVYDLLRKAFKLLVPVPSR